MLEQRRLDYLQAMGITQWMPRKPLANAPEPRWWPDEAANADTLDEPVVTQAQTTAVAAPAALAVPSAPVINTTSTPEVVANKTPPVMVEPQAVPEFQLFFTVCHLSLVWVTSNPQELQSLQRFVFALQKSLLGKPYHLYDPVEFKWPFLQSSKEDQSQAVALQALKAQWQVFQNTQPVQAITFGEQSQHWLQQAEIKALMHFSSLEELLLSADNKRQLWLTLSALQAS